MTELRNRENFQIEIDILASLGRDLAATTNAETAATIILDAADRLMGWDASYLILYDPAKGDAPRPLLTIDTVEGKRIIQRDAAPKTPSENMMKAIAQGGFLSQYEGFFEIEASRSFGDRRQRTLSQLFVPVISGSRTIGVLSIQSYKKRFYKDEQLDLLKDLASHCAGALERIWAQEAVSDFVERLKVLHAAVNAVNANLDMERVCQVVYETVMRVMPCDDFVIDGYDKEANEIVPIYAIEHPGRRVFTNRYIADHGLAGEIVQTKRSLLFNSVDELNNSGIKFELYGTHEEDPSQSIIAVPMILHGEIYGMVSAQSYHMNAYNAEDLYLLEVLASHAAIAIENARLFDSIQKLANTDPLTGILNRRRFFELAELEFAKAEMTNTPFSIIMLDVDDFKQFNDRYGHKVGDTALTLTAETCKSSLRADDILGRMGGEEFVVALPNTSLTFAIEVASRLRQAIQDTDFSAYLNNASKDSSAITVSVGVAEYTSSCKSLDVLLDRADKAMYISKNSGRNQVRVWENS